MAKGIEFYREYVGIESLKNSYETQIFTDRFNKLFNVFNRKHPGEGIKINSLDFQVHLAVIKIYYYFTMIFFDFLNQVLEDNLVWLNLWGEQ